VAALNECWRSREHLGHALIIFVYQHLERKVDTCRGRIGHDRSADTGIPEHHHAGRRQDAARIGMIDGEGRVHERAPESF